MKKFTMALSLMLVLIMTLSTAVLAGPDGIIENPETTVPFTTPTIDGNIDPNEGWSTAVLMNANTLGYFWAHNPLTSDGNLFYAVDNDGIYVAGKIVEGLSAIDMNGIDCVGMNQFMYSTGTDNIDVDANGTSYGWNGDVMGLMFDPLKALVNNGFTFNTDFSAWYLVGLHEGDVLKVYREKINAGDITDQIEGAGKATSDGWCFEIKIPWDIIVKDTNDASYGAFELKKEDILKTGADIQACALYQDRFYDEEQGAVQTWGRYITVATALPDGTPGHMGSGENIASYGIKLKLGEVPAAPDNNNNNNNNNNNQNNTNTNNNTNTTNKNNTTTNKNNTTSSANKGTGTGTTSPQTFDMGIVVALGALATSGIGFAISKKRR